MTLTIPSYKKPVEEVARVICSSVPGTGSVDAHMDNPATRQRWLGLAAAAITRLRELGFINDIGLAAIHAEEDSNGQPRSSVVPGQDT